MIEQLKNTITFGDIFAGLSMIGSVIAAIISWRNQRNAKKSEEWAEKYAANANKANIAAEEYYKNINQLIEEDRQIDRKLKMKDEVYTVVAMGVGVKTKYVADQLNIQIEEAFHLLLELRDVDGRIGSGGRATVENIDGVIWIKK